ncbi:hypothetical protein ACN28C_13660 [Plantactinospora sp. WMMC1484]|uniref:hypothetical protein n=1 Tax=Plantactinospora sp. WMMC1484 TaxID=3404122 RepID=UPI003BF51D2C
MEKLFSVYCSGSILKGSNEQGRLCWTDEERAEVAKGAAPAEVVFLNPDDPITDPGNTLGQFGRDMYQVLTATAVIVDARERRGLGIGVEMTVAALVGTAVIVVAPRNSKYRCDVLEYRGVTVRDYVHPHVASLAAHVVEDFVSAGAALTTISKSSPGDSQLPAWLSAALAEYEGNILSGDQPMLHALHRIRAGVGASR